MHNAHVCDCNGYLPHTHNIWPFWLLCASVRMTMTRWGQSCDVEFVSSQNPREADAMTKVQAELDETKIILVRLTDLTPQ